MEWKAHGQCSKGGSCSFSHDKQVQGDLHGGQRRKGRLSSPAPNSKAKTDEVREKSSNKFLATMRTSLQTKGENFHSDVKFLKTHQEKFGIVPCVKTMSLSPDVYVEENVSSDMLRLMIGPVKSQKKVVRKDQLHY